MNKNTKNNDRKNSGDQNRRAVKFVRETERKTEEKKPGFWMQMIPFFLAVIAVLVSMSYIFTEETGWFGQGVSSVFYGLFSVVAWVIPVLLINLAIFWKKDILRNSLKIKLISTGVVAVILSCMLFYVSLWQNNWVMPSMTPASIWDLAQKSSGFKFGGIIGSYIGWLIYMIFSKVGMPIVLVAAFVAMSIFLLNISPEAAWRVTKKVLIFLGKLVSTPFIWIFKKIFTKKEKTKKKLYINKPEPEESEEDEAPKKKKKKEPVRREGADNGSFTDYTEGYGKEDYDIKDELDNSLLDEDLDDIEDQTEKEEIMPEKRSSNIPKKTEAKEGDIDLNKLFPDSETESDKDSEVSISKYTYNMNNTEVKEEEDNDGIEVERKPLMSTVEEGDKIPTEKKMYQFPPIDILTPMPEPEEDEDFEAECHATGQKLVEVLRSFKVNTRLVNVSKGPTITRYELAPEEGVRVKAIAGLSDDIALGLAAKGAVRIEAPILGKAAVGIEIANQKREIVYLRVLLENPIFKNAKSKLTVGLGLDVAGEPIFMDISKMPHLLIAGTTGSGKSVCLNCIILSLLYKATSDEVKMIMIDPKKVEFNCYKELPHLISPVVSNTKKAAGALMAAVNEMERRYDLIQETGVRDITSYNQVTKDDPEREYLPHLVIVIDELADLMMTSRDSVETSICRIAQKGRACGIHLVIGTQRPSVDVITGLIKSNVPSRIAFTVKSIVDSRTIIDLGGAEKLINKGDMLYSPVGSQKPTRVQGAFVSDQEVERIVEFIKENNGKAKYNENIVKDIDNQAEKCAQTSKKNVIDDDSEDDGDSNDASLFDPKFKEAVQEAINAGKISTSYLQRKLSVGYGRAAKLIDAMEKLGIVSAPDGQKARNVLISQAEWDQMLMRKNDSEDF